jgi:hypothetical protein
MRLVSVADRSASDVEASSRRELDKLLKPENRPVALTLAPWPCALPPGCGVAVAVSVNGSSSPPPVDICVWCAHIRVTMPGLADVCTLPGAAPHPMRCCLPACLPAGRCQRMGQPQRSWARWECECATLLASWSTPASTRPRWRAPALRAQLHRALPNGVTTTTTTTTTMLAAAAAGNSSAAAAAHDGSAKPRSPSACRSLASAPSVPARSCTSTAQLRASPTAGARPPSLTDWLTG